MRQKCMKTTSKLLYKVGQMAFTEIYTCQECVRNAMVFPYFDDADHVQKSNNSYSDL